MKFLVEIDETVYGQVDVSAEWLEQEINVALDDCFSQHIKVRKVSADSEEDHARWMLKLP